MAEREVVDLIVETYNPKALDETVNQAPFGAAVVDGSWDGVEGPSEEPRRCRVRCFGNHGFVAMAIDQQGYGKVVGQAFAVNIAWLAFVREVLTDWEKELEDE